MSISYDYLNDTQRSEIDNNAVYAFNINSDKKSFVQQIIDGEKTIETRKNEITVNGRPLAVGDRVGIVQTGNKGRTILNRLGENGGTRSDRPLMAYDRFVETH